MRICVITAGDEPYHHGQRLVFERLADADSVGQHFLEQDPSRADALLVVDLQQHPHDPFLKALRRHGLVRRYADKVYVYDERDFPFFTLPGIYVSGTSRSRCRSLMVGGPYPSLPNAPRPTSRAPDLLYSFQGARTHPVRDTLLKLRHSQAVVEDTTNLDFFSAGAATGEPERQSGRARYAEIVARSKFVLCPRGHGPSSFRLYETMAGGRVPVVISDDWLAPPRVDWDGCAVRVQEKDAHLVPQLLEGVEDQWPSMVAAGQTVVERNFSDARLWHHYATSIADLARVKRLVPPWWAHAEVARVGVRRMRAVVARHRS